MIRTTCQFCGISAMSEHGDSTCKKCNATYHHLPDLLKSATGRYHVARMLARSLENEHVEETLKK